MKAKAATRISSAVLPIYPLLAPTKADFHGAQTRRAWKIGAIGG